MAAMTRLSLDQALAIVTAARARAAELGRAPLAYAVVDAGGHVLLQAREEDQAFGRGAIAVAKAAGAVAMGMGGARLAAYADGYQNWFTGIAGALGGDVVPTPGSVLVLGGDGRVVGAVAVAGAPSADDEAIARHAIAAAGLRAAD
jgi:uncharacterized protein GlcG (DUF336 family)